MGIDLSGAKTLEIGSSNGGLSLWMALNGAKVLCSDLSGPTNAAKEKHRKYSVSHLIDYGKLNVLDIPYEEEFDVVCFKSVLGVVGTNANKEKQIKALQQLHKSLKKGGELLFAENLVGSPLHGFLRKKFVPWGNTWRYVTIEEMQGMLSGIFSDVKYTTAGFMGAFGRTEYQRKILGYLDRNFVSYLVPGKWRYIIIGVARK